MDKKPKRMLDQVEAQMIKLKAKKIEIQEELKRLAAERTMLIIKETAERKAASMSPEERKALGIREPK